MKQYLLLTSAFVAGGLLSGTAPVLKPQHVPAWVMKAQLLAPVE